MDAGTYVKSGVTLQEAFDDFKTRLELNSSIQEAVTTHHTALRNWIESDGSGIKTKLIGSLQRRTRIQPLADKNSFDVDILVVLGEFYRWVETGGVKPNDALDKLENVVSENSVYQRIGIEQDSPAIMLEYADNITVELIPAYVDQIGEYSDGTPVPPKGRGYWVPRNNRWVLADYDYDAEYITKQNKLCDEMLVPAIKMLKSAKRHLFSDMKSYHLEVLASSLVPSIINYFKLRNELVTYPLLIYSFFLCAKDNVLTFNKIPGSKSSILDSDLTQAKRNELAGIFLKIAAYCGKILNLDDREGIEAWQKVFGEPFPKG